MENRDEQISGMSISIHTISTMIDALVCMLIENIRAATSEDAELQILQAHIIRGWPQNKDELQHSLGGHWPIRHALSIIYGIAIRKSK